MRRAAAGACVFALAILAGGASSALLAVCGPFTDTAADAFCPFVLEIFTLGITTGTTATTYSPGNPVTRLQMAAFLSRSVDRALQRGNRRTAAEQFWTPQNDASLGMTTILGLPQLLASDGVDIWVAESLGATVSRVRASDGKLLDTWTDAFRADSVLAGPLGAIFATGLSSPGRIYEIFPTAPAGAVTTVASNLGDSPRTIAFDGARIWTANNGIPSVSIVTPEPSIPWLVTTVTAGFSGPIGILYDGASVWVTDGTAGTLLKLSSVGAILQTVTVGSSPSVPVFDGANIWVPNNVSSTLTVVRASSGAVLATLTGNGLNGPATAAFDGERVLVTELTGKAVSFWKSADLSPLGFVPTTGLTPVGACSDGLNFWVTLSPSQLARF